MRRTGTVVALLCGLLPVGIAQLSTLSPDNPPAHPRAEFDRLVDEYFDDYFQHNPTAATTAGVHEYDHRLEDYSQAEVDRHIASLKQFATRFETPSR